MTDGPQPAGRQAFVHAAECTLAPGTDPAAVGAAVTVALCGHWEHDGACRWPHNNAIDTEHEPARFRTVFVAPAEDEAEVRERIDAALRGTGGWRLTRRVERDLRPDERALGERLARGAGT